MFMSGFLPIAKDIRPRIAFQFGKLIRWSR
jgi:hypothetical protein